MLRARFWGVWLVMLLVASAAGVSAQERLATIDWDEEASKEASPVSRLIADGIARVSETGTLELVVAEGGLEVTLWESSAPEISELFFAMVGEVRHEKVDGDGMLELLTSFSEGQFFSRTAGERGPMGKLTGDSGWREFALPFDASGGGELPRAVAFRVLVPSRGTIEISPIGLHQAESMSALFPSFMRGSSTQWGRWGGLMGAAIGLTGAAIGILAGKGRARSAVFAMCWTLLIVGILALGIGIGARFGLLQAPIVPWMSLGLTSFLLPLFLWPMLRRRYAELELRKMKAMDF